MPVTLHHESDNIYRVEIRGTLEKQPFDRVQDTLIARMGRTGTVRLLIVLDGFEGWAPQDNWRDLSFYVEHGNSIERMAIVGDERWRDLALMFASADLRQTRVEFFSGEAIDAARGWLIA
jgi:hypothetical protein